jgi:uncharacterized RDD family membrane protein YckC
MPFTRRAIYPGANVNLPLGSTVEPGSVPGVGLSTTGSGPLPAPELEYVGFWKRFVATLLDTLVVVLVALPVLKIYAIGLGAPGRYTEFVVETVLELVLVVALWVSFGATPGKMLFGARVVDSVSGKKPGLGQSLARYLAYYVSIAPLGLGFLWIAWDRKKQGFHDKIAGTVVVAPVATVQKPNFPA